MKVGTSTYALFWTWHAGPGRSGDLPETDLRGLVARGADDGAEVVQLCDHPDVERQSPEQLRGLRSFAAERGVCLEAGTRGVDAEHLDRWLDVCAALGSPLLRSMLPASARDPEGFRAAVAGITRVVPRLEDAGVDLALETYEQVPTGTLVDVVEAVGSDRVGICLDPGNCVAALEHPRDVVERCAPHVRNVHVKDFGFSRQDGWVGFTYAGAPLGEGLLDLDHLLDAALAVRPDVTCVVEQWVPWQGDAAATRETEAAWNARSLAVLTAQQRRRTPALAP
ncbi:sugar phosphate isomerase/epimerase family protein [Pseudokineococcus sp. 1T1Z-3]|uniref:sugar phosphate isomerase/epimerase family protein n=1 Tax=Pseudokineococcus sp. 1T1Z-3 TaxID=3132745 RepID=UPI00309AD4F9